MAAERLLQSLSNRIMDLDYMIEDRNKEIDTYAFVECMKNENTKRKTKSDMNRVKEWMASVDEHREIQEIPPSELNLLLARMFVSLRKVDGTEYEPDSIKSIQGSVHRYLQDCDYAGNIIKDDKFKHSRDVISSKRKHLKGQGKGNKKNRSDPFTDDEITILRQQGLLGGESPQALTNAIWLNNCIHFGLRGRQEHTSMLWGDVELQTTSSGVEYLAFTERVTKTRNGVTADPRAYVPKMFAQPGDDNCPVQLYKLYAEKRPEKMMAPESRFYIAVNPQHIYGHAWFMNSPLGKNKIGRIAKDMAEEGGLSGRHTNHSGRKTCITKLLQNNVAPTDVAQQSGHRHIMSLNQYNTVSIERQREMSTIVHHVDSVSTNVTESAADCSDLNDEMYDSELVAVSQEIEETLCTIARYENTERDSGSNLVQKVDLPIAHNSDGTMSVLNKPDPSSFSVNCTFNAPVNIVMK